jgi:imidazolonepropionase
MAQAGTAAVLLPGAFYFLPRDARRNLRAGRRADGARRCNRNSPRCARAARQNMAATFPPTVDECLTGMTRAAAGSSQPSIGTLEPATRDLAIWNVERPAS